jgi:hypothetical protein
MKRTPLRRATPLRRKKPLRVRRRKAVQDAVFARQIKERDGWACRLTMLHHGECRGQLQCCHIFGKQAYPHLRYDLDNAITGCAKGHLYGTYRPFEWYEFLKWFLPPGVFDALRLRATKMETHTTRCNDRDCPQCGVDSCYDTEGSPEERTPSLDAQRRDALRR